VKVLFVTAEMPFSKTGGLGDVSGSLPVKLKELNVDIKIITPFYRVINKKDLEIEYNKFSFQIKGLNKKSKVIIHIARYLNLQVLLVDIPEFFGREGVYNDNLGRGYSDNAERYATFCWAVLQHITQVNWIPDVFHINDWHTGFIPVWITNEFFKNKFIRSKIKILVTIHNLAYQGEFNKKVLEDLGEFNNNTTGLFSIYDKLNPLKASLLLSDIITTVSPTYSKEIQTKEFGAGLHDIIKSKSSQVYGILNGVNYEEWNPEVDPFLPRNYSLNNLEGKMICKKELLKKFNFKQNISVPLIGIISRLAHQKGFDLIIPVLEKILPKLNFLIVIYGSGYKDFEDSLLALETLYPDKLSVNIEYNNKMAHWVEAASDFFLMPSKYEPCGLNQMFSMRYGTIPIVRETGGLKDTVVDLRENPNNGSGFTFQEYSEVQLEKLIAYSIKWYNETDENQINLIRKRIMKQDFSWENSAKLFLEVYKK
jgi:starch synthase